MTHGEFQLEEEPQSNPIGVIGFILSLTICLGPIGFVVSLVGLTRRPRGFAVGGVLIGLIGVALWAFIGYAASIVKSEYDLMADLAQDSRAIREQIEHHQANNDDAYPASLDDLSLTTDAKTDPWGNAYSYRVSQDGTNFYITTMGKDQKPDTIDDLTFDRFLDASTLVGMAVVRNVGMLFGAGSDFTGAMQAVNEMISLKVALEAHAEETGDFPETLDALSGFDEERLTDPWGTRYHYEVEAKGRRYSLYSYGKDGVANSDDDIDADDIQIEAN